MERKYGKRSSQLRTLQVRSRSTKIRNHEQYSTKASGISGRSLLDRVWEEHKIKGYKSGRPDLKIEFRVQGVPLKAVPEDQGRMTKFQHLPHTQDSVQNGANVHVSKKTNSIRSVRGPKKSSKAWEISNYSSCVRSLRRYNALLVPKYCRWTVKIAPAEHVQGPSGRTIRSF